MTKIELAHPVEADGRTIKVLTMRRPKVRDDRDARRAGGSDDAEREIVLLANLCDVAPETVHDLDLADYRRLQDAYVGFFQADGPTPPPSAERSR